MDLPINSTHKIILDTSDFCHTVCHTILDSDPVIEKVTELSWEVGAGLFTALICFVIGCIWKCRLVLTCSWFYCL